MHYQEGVRRESESAKSAQFRERIVSVFGFDLEVRDRFAWLSQGLLDRDAARSLLETVEPRQGEEQLVLQTRPMLVNETFWARFERKVSPPNDFGCTLWTGSKTPAGYGKICLGGNAGPLVLAHRAAWFRAHGEIPQGLYVLHRCDVRSCVNVNHLFLGSAADNSQDMVAKGRAGNQHRKGAA